MDTTSIKMSKQKTNLVILCGNTSTMNTTAIPKLIHVIPILVCKKSYQQSIPEQSFSSLEVLQQTR